MPDPSFETSYGALASPNTVGSLDSGPKFITTIHKLYRAHPCNQESQSGHKYKTNVLGHT